ncbi:NAD(P)H-binding protein [Luedemannella helvata]|uniref:NAD(P)H-binding protein n=1 Tax=Luedemannella helvata TaxID=349315 RepID=A0ABP4WUD8_9ACTN
MSDEYLVVGASGMVGRRVVAELRRRDLPVRPAGRSGPTVFDWERPETWAPALAGVERAYLLWPQGTTQPQHRVAEFVSAVAGTSLRRLVLLSAYGVEYADGSGPRKAEQAVQDSDLDWTILRPNFFLQNFSEGFYTHTIRTRRTVEVPAGDAAVSFVDTRDIAAVAAVALTTEGHAGRGYTITGPAAVTFAEVAAALTAAGHPVTYRDVTPAQTREALVAAGIAPDYADLLLGIYARAAAGGNAAVTDAVQRVTGRPARDLATYLRDTIAEGLIP